MKIAHVSTGDTLTGCSVAYRSKSSQNGDCHTKEKVSGGCPYCKLFIVWFVLYVTEETLIRQIPNQKPRLLTLASPLTADF